MLRKLIASLFFTLIVFFNANAQDNILQFEGIYQGENLFVVNPFASSGVGFCIFEVTVNGQITTDEINSSAFELDFGALDHPIGTPVTIEIKHKPGCKPTVVNPMVLKPRSTFEITDIQISHDGKLLTWETTKEAGELPYLVKQYKWGKWITVGEVPGVGKPGTHKYEFKTTSHSGQNKFKVVQIDYTNKPRESKEVIYMAKAEKVEIVSTKVTDYVEFTGETMYEIFDSYGNIVEQGTSAKVNISHLDKGKYYVNFDNSYVEITKKK
jgi:hypothetical protein